jgi:glycosyltransferase involved in cell wall biosynthesis
MLETTRLLTRRNPFCGIPAEGWIFRGGFTYQDSTELKDRLWKRLFRSSVQSGLFEALHLDDEILYDFALQIPKPKTQIELARNPVLMAQQKTASLARAELHVAECTTIGTAGMIDTRKGCDLLINAHHQMFRQGNQTQLLLAGPHSDGIRSLIHDRIQETPGYAQWILSYDRFLNEEEIFDCMSACDLVIAPYPKHSGRSSIILWAATCGRPSLATDRGCLAHVVKTERLGEVTSVENAETLANSIKTMIGREWTPSDHKRWRSYAEFHSIENYQRSAVKHLSLRLPQ